MAEEKLAFASWDDVPKIVEKLKKNYPETGIICGAMEKFYTWKTSSKPLDAFLLTPNGKVDDYGTVVLIIPGKMYNITFDSTNTDFQRMKRLLKESSDINWSLCPAFGPVHNRYFTMMKELVIEMKMEVIPPENIYLAYFIEKEKAQQLTYTCPDGVDVGPLLEKHAEQINNNWPLRAGEHSTPHIAAAIRNNGGVGVFLKDTKELVSWVISWYFGGPGVLQTEEAHKRKGYGKVVASSVTKMIADLGSDVFSIILNTNNPSLSLFKSIGYTQLFSLKWYNLKPIKSES